MRSDLIALVPIKDRRGAKSRLSPYLDEVERQCLALHMLEDVLTALAGVTRLTAVLVSHDDEAIRLAQSLRMITIPDRGLGETDAVQFATSWATNRCAQGTLVIPADVPLITSQEIKAILTASEETGIGSAENPSDAERKANSKVPVPISSLTEHKPRSTVLVPSRDGRGTNAALRCPPDLFPLRFGNDSFQPHVAQAERSGAPCKILPLPGLGLDIDEADDLRELVNRPGQTQSQRYVRSMGIADRLMAAW